MNSLVKVNPELSLAPQSPDLNSNVQHVSSFMEIYLRYNISMLYRVV